MKALANSAEFWVLLILVLCAAYLLPTIIGAARGVDRLALVFLVNLIGGTTGVGWLAALILAFGPRRLDSFARPVSGRRADELCIPWPPQRLAETRGLMAMRTDAEQPDHFGCAEVTGRETRHENPVSCRV